MTTRRYAPEYRRQMVELVRTGRTAEELSREFECSAQAIRNWVRQADLDSSHAKDIVRNTGRTEGIRLAEMVQLSGRQAENAASPRIVLLPAPFLPQIAVIG